MSFFKVRTDRFPGMSATTPLDFRLYNFFYNPFAHNWFNFPLIRIEPNWSRCTGEVSFKLELVGVGLEITYTYDWTRKFDMWNRMGVVLEQSGLIKKENEDE